MTPAVYRGATGSHHITDGDIRRARIDHANKDWLRQDADDERRGMQMLVGALLFGALIGLVAFDWTQGCAWAHALVDLIYAQAPL